MLPSVSGFVVGGRDFREVQNVILGELCFPHIPFFPFLPARGVGWDLNSRSILCLSGMSVDLQPYGWRLLGGGSGVDQKRLYGSFREDYNIFSDILEKQYVDSVGFSDFRLQILGPWSLAAAMFLSSGRPVLGDFGAYRDLVDSFSVGIVDYVKNFLSVLGGTRLVVHICEPRLQDIVSGLVPTSSGYGTVGAVSWERIIWGVERVVASLVALGVRVVFDSPRSTNIRIASFDFVSDLVFGIDDVFDVGEFLERGLGIWFNLGVVGEGVFESLFRSVTDLGFAFEDVLDQLFFLPSFFSGDGGSGLRDSVLGVLEFSKRAADGYLC